MDGAEDHEHQDERSDELGEEALHVTDPKPFVELRHAESNLVRSRSEHADDGEGTDRGADELGCDVSGTSLHGNLPVLAKAIVTAGLMWLPDTWPSAYTVATTTIAKANEIMPRSAIVNGESPLTMSVAGTDPTPMNTSSAVPSSSASSFWGCVLSSIEFPFSLHVAPGRLLPIDGFPGLSRKSEDHSIMSNDVRMIGMWSRLVKRRVRNPNLRRPPQRGVTMIQSVDRAVRILLALQGARRINLSDLAAQLGLPNSTVHGILRTLAEHGMVEQEPGSVRYMLAPPSCA